jgi:hypothetical protein
MLLFFLFRHCERSEAIYNSGLLRFARNDDIHLFTI